MQRGNEATRVRLSEVQRQMVETARVRGRVTVALRDKIRRRAALRLKAVGLLTWSEHIHAWTLTEAGRIHCSRAVARSTGTRVERHYDRTPGMEYSDYCRAN